MYTGRLGSEVQACEPELYLDTVLYRVLGTGDILADAGHHISYPANFSRHRTNVMWSEVFFNIQHMNIYASEVLRHESSGTSKAASFG